MFDDIGLALLLFALLLLLLLLLPQYQYLLMVDKDELCGGTLSEKRDWKVRMKSAKKAKIKTTEDEGGGDTEER